MDFYQILLIVIASLVVIITLGILVFKIKKRKEHKKTHEFPELLEALGGVENISEPSYKGSRVSVVVDNKKTLDREKMKEQGVETIVISGKKVTMVVGNRKSILIYNYINDKLNS